MNTLQHCRYWYHIFVRLSICLFLTSVRCQNTWVFLQNMFTRPERDLAWLQRKQKEIIRCNFVLLYQRWYEKAQYSTNISLCLRNPQLSSMRVVCRVVYWMMSFSMTLTDLIHSVICIIAALDLEMIFSMIALILLLSRVFQCVLLKFPHLINPG